MSTKVAGSRKAKPTPNGELQTAGAGLVIGGALALGTTAYLMHQQYKAEQAYREIANEEAKKDKDSKK
tara:strand:- start:54 stop:257 length:204 start_codon:yes stop_codon:yes gene_type:complete